MERNQQKLGLFELIKTDRFEPKTEINSRSVFKARDAHVGGNSLAVKLNNTISLSLFHLKSQVFLSVSGESEYGNIVGIDLCNFL